MSNITQIPDYTINLELMLEQYKLSTKLRGIIDSANDSADDIETALFEIRDLFYIDTAEGVQLDTIGAVFGINRGGDTDAVYREKIKTKGSLTASGEPEAIIEILLSLYGATYVTYIPAYPGVPAAYYLMTDASVTIPSLRLFSPAGVEPMLVGYLVDQAGNNIVDQAGNKILHASG